MAQNPVVTFEMNDGSVIKAELYPEIAPNTVNNFISLVKRARFLPEFQWIFAVRWGTVEKNRVASGF